ncbi:MAG TPA: hypothetical protein PLE74_07940 [Candidatus Cloacimonadota bacterium]|nr:hypothetical protein [Candidatus Cloacimonadota bacterium]
MGTSESFSGPKRPLLPSDFDEDLDKILHLPFELLSPNNPDSENNEENVNQEEREDAEGNQNNIPSWRSTKTRIARYANGQTDNYRPVLSSYVKSHGGARNASKTSKAGIYTTIRFGYFLDNVSKSGIHKYLEENHIEYEGRKASDILSEIINNIAPSPDTKEDAIARNALLDTMQELLEKFNLSGDIEILNNMNGNNINYILATYISSYIYHRILSDLEMRFEKYSKSPKEAKRKEKDIKEYISGTVEGVIKKINPSQYNYTKSSIKKLITDLYYGCYKAIEGDMK